MTVDVDPPFSPVQNFIIEKGIHIILNLFDKYSVKATFFVPATVAENFPLIMEEIVKRRHEIASHGLKHDPWEATLNLKTQIKIIKMATETIESVTGLRPKGFRAPLFKINRNCWIALEKNGYMYDSSVVCSPLYGEHKLFLGVKPFSLSGNGSYNLLEIPVSVNPFLPLPLGGAWLRIFGLRWAKIGIKMNFIYQTPVVFYIHPKDVVLGTYNPSWYYYRNIDRCTKMLEEIICYAKRNGTKFMKACELARLFEQNS